MTHPYKVYHCQPFDRLLKSCFTFFFLWASSGWCKFFHWQATTRWPWWKNCHMTSTWHFHPLECVILVLCISKLGIKLTLHLICIDTLTMHSSQRSQLRGTSLQMCFQAIFTIPYLYNVDCLALATDLSTGYQSFISLYQRHSRSSDSTFSMR